MIPKPRRKRTDPREAGTSSLEVRLFVSFLHPRGKIKSMSLICSARIVGFFFSDLSQLYLSFHSRFNAVFLLVPSDILPIPVQSQFDKVTNDDTTICFHLYQLRRRNAFETFSGGGVSGVWINLLI